MADTKDQKQVPSEGKDQKSKKPASSPQTAGGAVKDENKQQNGVMGDKESSKTSPEKAEGSEEPKENGAQNAALPSPPTKGKEIPKELLELLDEFRNWCIKKHGSPGKAWKQMDVNGNGKLSCAEFINQCVSWRKGSYVKKVFNLLNCEHNDGVIVWSEFVGAKLPSVGKSASWVAEAQKAKIKDATRKPPPPPEKELTKEEKLKIAMQEFQDWCLNTFDSPAAVLKHFDTSRNGEISCAEFMERCGVPRRGKPSAPGNKEMWKTIFHVLDVNHSGLIGKPELYDPLTDKFAIKDGASKDGASKEEAPSPKKSPKTQNILRQLEAGQGGTGGKSSEHEWTKRTFINLRGTDSLLHEMTSHLRDHALDGDGGICTAQQRSQSQNLSNVLDNKLRKKISRHETAARATESLIDGVTRAAAEMRRCAKEMRAAHRALWMTLSVCEMRLDLRESRPPPEQIRDGFQKALEEEWEITFNAREDLLERIAKAERMVLALEEVKEGLIVILYNKRRDARDSRSQMMSSISPRDPRGATDAAGSGSAWLPPAAPEDLQRAALPEGPNEQIDEKAVLARAIRLEEIARKLYMAGDAAIVQGQEVCKQAVRNTQQQMGSRIKKVGKLTDIMKKELVQTESTIHEAELSFGRSLHNISGYSGSSMEGDFSTQLVGPGISSDETDGEGLELEGDLQLPKKWQATANVLCRLKQSGVRLQEDLKHKVHALRIDARCRKVTPRYASTELGRLRQGGKLAKVPQKEQNQDTEVAEKTFTTI